MNNNEFSNQFDLLFNNVTSNQAPGLNEWEKSSFLTIAQEEILKNYFNPKGNKYGEGFDGSRKRQMDFSRLIRVRKINKSDVGVNVSTGELNYQRYDPRSYVYVLPNDVFLIINEQLIYEDAANQYGSTIPALPILRQIVPLSLDEYTRLMSKPYKEPLKYQAWRILSTANALKGEGQNAQYLPPIDDTTLANGNVAEVITRIVDKRLKVQYTPSGASASTTGEITPDYLIRYLKRPQPIILSDFSGALGEGISIHGYTGHEDIYSKGGTLSEWKPCELEEEIHEEILQRAVELAKVAWTNNGQDNVQLAIEAGKRSE